jgi:zinc D-Ala-D-Ala carboxypeptidase
MSTLIDFILGLFKSAKTNPSISMSISLGSGYDADKSIERSEDKKLSDHFSLFEMTITSNMSLQKQNRMLSDNQVQKLEKLSRLAETIRALCSAPILIHSGYRSSNLNEATIGSSSTSQHPKCEAIDFDVKGQEIDATFAKLLAAAKEGKLKFGQLILERAERTYGTVKWIHCSVIGTLAPEKIGQVLKMEAGVDGKPLYSLITQINQC